jgi:phage-related protein
MAITFETLIKCVASFTGGAALASAANSVKAVEKSAVMANFSLKKLALGAAGVVLGFKGFEKISSFLKKGIDDAREEARVIEKLNAVTAGQFAKRKLSPALAKADSAALASLSEQMEKTGIQSESLMAGVSKLMTYGMSPEKIRKFLPAFEGVVVKMHGFRAGTAEATDTAFMLGQAITNGIARPLVTAEILTKKQATALSKMHSAGERWAYLQPILAKYQDFVAGKMGTTEYKVWQAEKAWGNLGKALGRPFVKAQDSFKIASGKIAESLIPIADRIAPKLEEAMNKLAKALDDSGPAIEKAAGYIAAGFEWVIDNWDTVVTGIESIVGALLLFKTVEGISKTIDNINKSLVGLGKLGGIWGALTSPMGLVIIGLVAVAAAIYLVITHWDEVKAAGKVAWDAIQQAWGNVGPWFQEKFNAVKEATRGVWEPLQEPLSRLGAELGPIVQQVATEIVDYFKDVPNQLQFIWERIVDTGKYLQNLATIIAPYAQQAFQNWLTAVGWVSSNIITPIINAFTDMVHAIRVGDIAGVFQPWLTAAQTIGQNIINAIVTALTPIVEQVKTSVIQPIVDSFNTIAGQIAGAIGGVYDAIIKPFVDAYNYISSLFSGIAGIITNAVSSVVEGAKAQIRKIPLVGESIAGKAPEGKQYGGLVTAPGVFRIAEKAPEMVIPLQASERSRGLLTQTAGMLGVKGFGPAAAGPQNVSVSIPITINGAQAGQEGAIGREIERAMQNPVKELLRQLHKAREEEQRLADA